MRLVYLFVAAGLVCGSCVAQVRDPICLVDKQGPSAEGYLRADQRACRAALENLHEKYSVTAKQIEAKRDAAATQLAAFMVELGYA